MRLLPAVCLFCAASLVSVACHKEPERDGPTALEVHAANAAVEILQDARVDTARVDLASLSNAVTMYIMSERSAPGSLTELETGGYVAADRFSQDPWGNAYVYATTGGTDFTIYSAGPNGIPGDDDDVHPEAR